MIKAIKNHVVITGTGRAGTTFLVELLTHLGLDTGFLPHETKSLKNEVANAGLELKVGAKLSPYIIKDTWFCDYVQEVLNRNDIEIEHVFIPIRNIESAAASRRLNSKLRFSKLTIIQKIKYVLWPYPFEGGLKDTQSMKKGKQEKALMDKLYHLLFCLSTKHIPVTFIHFPKMTTHPEYVYHKLKPVLKEISYDDFICVYHQIVQN